MSFHVDKFSPAEITLVSFPLVCGSSGGCEVARAHGRDLVMGVCGCEVVRARGHEVVAAAAAGGERPWRRLGDKHGGAGRGDKVVVVPLPQTVKGWGRVRGEEK